jgi:hypothetical protein
MLFKSNVKHFVVVFVYVVPVAPRIFVPTTTVVPNKSSTSVVPLFPSLLLKPAQLQIDVMCPPVIPMLKESPRMDVVLIKLLTVPLFKMAVLGIIVLHQLVCVPLLTLLNVLLLIVLGVPLDPGALAQSPAEMAPKLKPVLSIKPLKTVERLALVDLLNKDHVPCLVVP